MAEKFAVLSTVELLNLSIRSYFTVSQTQKIFMGLKNLHKVILGES